MQDQTRVSEEVCEPQDDRCEKLVRTLENCERQLKNVRLELTELQRTGPRDGFTRLQSNRLAIERKIERVSRLISACTLSWNAFHSKSEIVRSDGKRTQGLPRSRMTFG
jgi:hypothetical protein